MRDTILKTTQEKWLSCVLVFCYHTCPILTRKSYQSFLFPCDRFKIVALVEVRTAEAEESHWHVSTWGWQISWFSSLTEIQKTWVFCKIRAESRKRDSRISLSRALAGEYGEYPLNNQREASFFLFFFVLRERFLLGRFEFYHLKIIAFFFLT